jgi:hypothetical protein
MDDHYFPVDDGLAGDIEGTEDDGEALRPVEASAGIGFRLSSVPMELDPVAVVFDLVEPLVARGSLRAKGGELGLNEARHFRKIRTLHNTTHKKPAVNTAGSLAIFLPRVPNRAHSRSCRCGGTGPSAVVVGGGSRSCGLSRPIDGAPRPSSRSLAWLSGE